MASVTPPTPPIDAYVDGACTGNPGPAGYGVVLISGRHRKELCGFLGQATNNVAELAAALAALRAIRDRARPLRLLTDSAYVHGLMSYPWKPKANRSLVAALRAEARLFPRLQVVRVPGHAGVAGNERADALAREAIARAAPAVVLRELIDGGPRV
jgi:ribonuclease HI